jgi:thiamine-monophosphate kinase
VATLADLGEREAIRRVQEILGRRAAEAARLDDAAVVRLPAGTETVTTTDTLALSTHRLAGAPMRLFGYFACAVSVSDLAAMGATPRGMLLAVGLPRSTPEGDLWDLALGFRSAANRLDFDVWGGDLKEAEAGYVTGTAVGSVPRGRALRRARGVAPGWTVGVTGFLGRAAFGAAIAAKGDALGYELVYNFEPRVEAGLAAAAVGGKVACIDSSDGLSASLLHLAAVNLGVGFELDRESLPVQPGLRKLAGPAKALELALDWGGDYELVFCAPPRTYARLKEALRARRIPLTAVGRAVAEDGLFLAAGAGRERLGMRGFEHFRSAADD